MDMPVEEWKAGCAKMVSTEGGLGLLRKLMRDSLKTAREHALKEKKTSEEIKALLETELTEKAHSADKRQKATVFARNLNTLISLHDRHAKMVSFLYNGNRAKAMKHRAKFVEFSSEHFTVLEEAVELGQGFFREDGSSGPATENDYRCSGEALKKQLDHFDRALYIFDTYGGLW